MAAVFNLISSTVTGTLQVLYRSFSSGSSLGKGLRNTRFESQAKINGGRTAYSILGTPTSLILFPLFTALLRFGGSVLDFISEFAIFVCVRLVQNVVMAPSDKEDDSLSRGNILFNNIAFIASLIALIFVGFLYMILIIVRFVVLHLSKITFFLLCVALFVYFAGNHLQDMVDFVQSSSRITMEALNFALAGAKTANEAFTLGAPIFNKPIRNAGIEIVTIYETLSGEVIGTSPNRNSQLLFPSDDPLMGRRLDRAPLYTEDSKATIDRIIATGLKVDEIMFILTITVVEIIGDLGIVSIFERLLDVFEVLVTKFICMIGGRYCGFAEILDLILNDVLFFVFRQLIGWLSFLFTGQFTSLRIDVSCGTQALIDLKIPSTCAGCVLCVDPPGFYQHAPTGDRSSRRLDVSCEMIYGMYQESINDLLHSQSYSKNDSCPLTKQSMHAFGNSLNLELLDHHACYHVKVDGVLLEVCPDGSKRILGSYGKKDHDLDSAIRHINGHLDTFLTHEEFTSGIKQSPINPPPTEKPKEEKRRLTSRISFDTIRADVPSELVFKDGSRYVIKTEGNFWMYAENFWNIGQYVMERGGNELFPTTEDFKDKFDSHFSSDKDSDRHLSTLDYVGKLKHRRRKLQTSTHMNPLDRMSLLVGVTPVDYDVELQDFLGRVKRRSTYVKNVNEKRRTLQIQENQAVVVDKRQDVINRRILSIRTCVDQQFKCDGIDPLYCVDNLDQCPSGAKLGRVLPLASYYINQGAQKLKNVDFSELILDEFRCYKELKENPDLDCSSLQNIGKTDEATYENCFMCAGMIKPYFGEISEVEWSLQSEITAQCTSDTDFNSCVCPNFYALSTTTQLSQFGYITQDFWYTFLNALLWIRYLFSRFVIFWPVIGGGFSSMCGDEVCTKSVSYALLGAPTDMTPGQLDACWVIHTGSFGSLMAFLYLFLIPLSLAVLWYFDFLYSLMTEVVFRKCNCFKGPYDKYHKMKRAGATESDIKIEMIMDGLEPVILDTEKTPFNADKFVRDHFGVFPSITKSL